MHIDLHKRLKNAVCRYFELLLFLYAISFRKSVSEDFYETYYLRITCSTHAFGEEHRSESIFLYLVLVWLPTCIISFGRLLFCSFIFFPSKATKISVTELNLCVSFGQIFYFFHPQCIWLAFNLFTLQLSHLFTLQISQISMCLLFQITRWFIFYDIKLCKLGPLHYYNSTR